MVDKTTNSGTTCNDNVGILTICGFKRSFDVVSNVQFVVLREELISSGISMDSCLLILGGIYLSHERSGFWVGAAHVNRI